MVSDFTERSRRRQTDEFGIQHGDTFCFRQRADRLPDSPQRRGHVVENVHRNLDERLRRQRQSEGLDTGQPSVTLSDPPSDALGDGNVSAGKLDVVGDQEGPSANGDGTRTRMRQARPEVRLATGQRQGLGQTFEPGRRTSASTARSDRRAARP